MKVHIGMLVLTLFCSAVRICDFHVQQASYLVFNECCKGQIVEEVCEILPHISISVLPQAFIVKAISAIQVNPMRRYSEVRHTNMASLDL